MRGGRLPLPLSDPPGIRDGEEGCRDPSMEFISAPLFFIPSNEGFVKRGRMGLLLSFLCPSWGTVDAVSERVWSEGRAVDPLPRPFR
jgi:hypothetical protein